MRTDGKAIGIGHNSQKKQPKSAKERAKSHYQRKTEAGWRKTWVDPDTLALSEAVGGIENIPQEREEDKQTIQDLGDELSTAKTKLAERNAELDQLKSRGFWARLLNKKS